MTILPRAIQPPRTTAPQSRAGPKLWPVVAGGIVLLSALSAAGYVWYESGGKPGKAAKAISAKQTEYVGLAYPVSSGTLPKSIHIKYDGGKDRTRMTLGLSGVQLDPGGSASDVQISLVSQFSGAVRTLNHAESSVDGTITLFTTLPGVLAAASPPGTFTVGSTVLETQDRKKGKSGYTSSKAGNGYTETLAFKVDVKDLIMLAKSSSAHGNFGQLGFSLKAEQITDLREFAARLNPQP